MSQPSESSASPFHVALVLSDLLGRIPPLLISPALAGMAAIAAWPWQQPVLQAAAGITVALAVLADGLSLSMLPRRGRSYGPVTPSLLALAFVRAVLTFAFGVAWPTWPALALTVLIQSGLFALQAYATWVEPFRLTLTRLELPAPWSTNPAPLRLLHVSDIHFEGWTPRERRLLELARAAAPDLVLLTGDYLNLSTVEDEAAQAGVRALVQELSALAPTYAITGSPPVDLPHVVPGIFAGLPVTWLVDRVAELEVRGRPLRLVGLRCTRDRLADGKRLRRLWPRGAEDRFTVLLYHSPDLAHEAAEIGADLYLAGHTHGGQICLPFFGALITSSAFWKRYERGRHRIGQTTLYVSRGLGMEGLGAPRARFLAPPEVVVIELLQDVEQHVDRRAADDG